MSFLRIGDILESRHMTGILVYLMLNGPRYKSEIYRNVSNSPRMQYKLEQLEECGMVTMTQRGKRTEVELTDSGQMLADHLYEMEKTLYGDRFGEPWPEGDRGRGRPPGISRRTCCP
ncbi:MAG: hypothetical protein Q4Q58_05735 [Thermoplasmata archaeon]|nr:hypothetical protein [Thermoplasmata archaeon]